MITPNQMMEVWLQMMTEATRGNNDVQKTMKSLTGTAMTPDEMLRMVTRFLPVSVGPVTADSFNQSLEEYWKMMGVVPRYRYLELLERNEELRVRLDDAERTIQQLRPIAAVTAQPEEAKKIFDLWSNMLTETMKAQTDLLRSMTATTPAKKDASG